MIWSQLPPGRSVRPMLPAKSVSPATSSLSGAKWRQTEPWVCPGVCRTLGGIALEPDGPAIVPGSRPAAPSLASPRPASWPAPHHFELRQIAFVQLDGRAGEPLQLERAADVVDMAVGDENLLQLEACAGEPLLDARDFVAGIDDDGFARLLRRREWCNCIAAGRREMSPGSWFHFRRHRPRSLTVASDRMAGASSIPERRPACER